MVLDCATLIALILGMLLVQAGEHSKIDWHSLRGLSFLQLGLRQLAALCDRCLPIPPLLAFPQNNPPPSAASKRKQEARSSQFEFSRVVIFST
jgi:hypothetical protein